MFFNKVKCIFLKIQNCLCNKKGSASVEHMLILPIVILILTVVLNLSVGLVEKGQHVLERLSESRKTLLQIIKDKSGSITVFLCLFMTGFIILLTVLCDITGLYGGKAYFDDCSLTSMVSISTAYDEQLKEKYRLTAIGRQEIPSIETLVRDNFQKTVHDEEGTMYPVQALNLCILENKTLSDENELKGQVVKVARDMAAELAFESFRERLQDGGTSLEVNNDVAQESWGEITEQEKEVDGKVKEVLPEIFGRSISGNITESMGESKTGFSIAQEIEQGVFDQGQEDLDWLVNNTAMFSDNVAIGEYVIGVFSNRCSVDDSGKGVPEAEYVISGKEDEDKSCKAVEDKIFALMYVLNAKFFLTNPQYIAKTAEAVTKYSGGNAYVAAALKVIIPMAWISAESKLDVNNLINNETVPINKTATTWQTKTIEQAGISSIINSVSGSVKDNEKNSEKKGKSLTNVSTVANPDNNSASSQLGKLSYKDCLRLFLLLESSHKKLARIRDVVENGVGTSFEELVTEVELRTEGSSSCLFTSGSWLPDKYKEGDNGQTVKMSNRQVFNFGGIGENG